MHAARENFFAPPLACISHRKETDAQKQVSQTKPVPSTSQGVLVFLSTLTCDCQQEWLYWFSGQERVEHVSASIG